MDMNIQKYLAFVKTAEYGSFTKAAELLDYSQSGISRMIGDLEREWNVILMERGRSGTKLTSDGIKLLPYAKSLCAEYEKMQTEVDELNGIQSGLIRIGTFASVAEHWLPNIIRAFQKDYPGIDYELLLGDYAEIEQWIADGRVDCGFTSLPARPGFDTLFLEQDRLVAVLPENHRLAGLEKVSLAELCSEPFMLLDKDSNTGIAGLFSQCGLKPDIRFTTWDDYAIMAMVESGLGVSILPELILKRVPWHIAVRELEIPAYRKIGVALRDRRSASRAVRRFLDYLQFRSGLPAETAPEKP
ncbi:MAG: LysR family transcriptional regulator [Pyramidobacter sp.]